MKSEPYRREGSAGASPADTITILLPTRKRPQSFLRALNSIATTVQRPELLEVTVGIDRDDEEAASILVPTRYDFPITIVRCEPRETLGVGHKSEILRAQARDSALVGWLADDAVMATPGWDEAAREAAHSLPHRLGILHFDDPTYGALPAYPLLTRETIAELGFLMAPWTPYWFCDTWLLEIGNFIGILRPLAAQIASPDGRGKTRGMRELDFWCDWFNRMRPHRIAAAHRLIDKIHADRPDLAASCRAAIPALAEQHGAYMESVLANAKAIEDSIAMTEDRPLLTYVRAKQQAQAMLEALTDAK